MTQATDAQYSGAVPDKWLPDIINNVHQVCKSDLWYHPQIQLSCYVLGECQNSSCKELNALAACSAT